MSFQKIALSIALLSLSSLPSMADLIAGIKFGDTQEQVEKKLQNSSLADAKINKSLFGKTGLNGAFKTTTKMGGLQYAIYYNWDDNNKLEHLNFHSQYFPKTDFQGKLKSSWSHLTNLLSSINGKATNANDFPSKGDIAMDAMYFTHEWKTETGYIYMGPGLEVDGYTLVITFTKEPLTASE